jgi:hypothetical protein
MSADTSAQTPPDQQPDPPAQDAGNELLVIGSWISAAADIARTLGPTELRLFIELSSRQIGKPGWVEAGSRTLAKWARASRSATQAAIDNLTKRCILTVRQGNAVTGARYRVNVFDVAQVPGPKFGPPPRPEIQATLALSSGHPGPEFGPPPTDSKQLTAAAASVEISTASLGVLDRVFSATAAKADPNDVRTFRAWLHGYMIKLGRDDANKPLRNPHPPDEKLVAQFLAVDDPKLLGTMLDNLMLEGHTCQRYFWFVTVALQRRHGIGWQETKRVRQALRIVKAGNKPDSHAQDYAQQLALSLTKKVKSL